MSDHTPANDGEEQPPEDTRRPRPLSGLTGFKRDQLFVIQLLAERNPHGITIKGKLECFYDEEVNQGRLYQNLGELIEEGYVEKYPLDGRTNAYRPSDRAARRLAEHLEWERRCLEREGA